MQSGSEPTLNIHHIGMIRSIISNNIHVIKVGLTKQGNSLQKIIDYINKTIDTPISEKDEKNFLEKKLVNNTALFKDLPLRTIQLSAIFNPNFNVLNDMGVINNAKDNDCKITSENFTEYKNKIREFSIISLDRYIRREKDLSSHRSGITILSNVVSEDIDDEFKNIIQKTQ